GGLRIDVRSVGRHQGGSVGTHRGGVTQLLFGFVRTQRQHLGGPAVGFLQLDGGLDRALLVRASRERQVRRLQAPPVFGDHDPGARRRHPFHTYQDPHVRPLLWFIAIALTVLWLLAFVFRRL